MQVYWLWLSMLPGLSQRQKLALLQHFSDPEAIYHCKDYSDYPELTGEQLDALRNKDLTGAERLCNICLRKDIGILTIQDSGYPSRLRNIADPPLVLYYKGILPDFSRHPAIGVVGTRKATAYGMNTARQFGAQISSCGGLVVSGGAAGVDSMALQGALDVGGQTVAVLGCGPDVVYPRTNRRLFMQIQEQGCVLSEYLPGTQPKPWQFPERNRIISGISNGILVIEAPGKSGALITARYALEHGRDLYVVPANIDMATCAGSNALLADGAMAVLSGWDVLREYEAQYPHTVVHDQSPKKTPLMAAQPVILPISDKKDIDILTNNSYSVKIDGDQSLTQLECRVLTCLDRTPRPIDEIIAQLDMPAGEILTVITKLSLKGMVVNHPGRQISAKK